MKCQHPFESLRWGFNHVHNSVRTETASWCGECSHLFYPDISAQDFLRFRGGVFASQTGMVPTLIRDMFYREMQVGDLVVYPAMSGRSAQIVAGEIVEINPNRKRDPLTPDEIAKIQAKGRVGEPYSLKIQPTGVGSRWKQHHGVYVSGQGYTGVVKPVTLWANAGSAVLVK